MKRVVLTALLASAVSTPLSAQQHVSATVTAPVPAGGAPTVALSGFNAATVNELPATGGQIDITCVGLACAALTVSEKNNLPIDKSPSPTGLTLLLSADPSKEVSYEITLALPGAAMPFADWKFHLPQGTTPLTDEQVTTGKATANCGSIPSGIQQIVFSPRAVDFVVSPIGNVYWRTPRHILRGDSVRIVIWGEKSLLPALKVDRTSQANTIVLNNIVGQAVDLSSVRGVLQRTGKAITIACDTVTRRIGDVAPGQATATISLLPAGTKIGSFDFTVYDTYTGAFSIGVIRTRVRNPSFGKSFNGTDTVVTETADRNDRILWVVNYTPFIWGRRDVTTDPPEWYQHLNPTVGLVLNDVPNNALLGVTIDFNTRIYATIGVHAGRVTSLDPNAHVSVGSKFANRSSTVPTVTDWKYGLFYGATVDLEAGVLLIKSLVTGVAPSGSK
jgi:hypothetical protein